MKTIGDQLRECGKRLDIPARTLDQVKEYMAETKAQNCDQRAAALMLKHGRMTDDARDWLSQEYPQGK